jgi:hypothetical protein
VARYRGNYKVKAFSYWDQFLCMTFAQLTSRESLRDIEDCLAARSDQLYHLGFRSRVCRSTLADANEVRDWRIYADLATLLIKKARRLYAGQEMDVELQQSVYALVVRLLNNSYSIILAKGYLPGSLDLGQDLLSFSPPHITLGIEIMLGEVLHDSVD